MSESKFFSKSDAHAKKKSAEKKKQSHLFVFVLFFWKIEQNERARGLKTDQLFYEAGLRGKRELRRSITVFQHLKIAMF